MQNGTENIETLNKKPDGPAPSKIDLLDYGINTLGNMVWSVAELSPNLDYYGDLHDDGHMVIGFSHDPKGQYSNQVCIISTNL